MVKNKVMTSGQKKIVKIFIGVVICVLLTLFILPRFIDINRYKNFITSRLESEFQGKVELSQLSWGISNGIWIKANDLNITDAKAIPIDLKIDGIFIKLSLLELLKKRIEIIQCHIQSPIIKIILNPVKRPKKNQEKSSPSFALIARHFQIIDGKVEITDNRSAPANPVTHILGNVELQVPEIIPGNPIRFQASAKTKPESTINISGRFEGLSSTFTIENPKLKCNVKLSKFDIDHIKPYLKNDHLDRVYNGFVSMELNYDGNLSDLAHLKGKIELNGLSYKDDRFWENILKTDSTTINYDIKTASNDLLIKNLGIKTKNSHVTGNFTIQDWKTHPIIKTKDLHTVLYLNDIDSFIPWKTMESISDVYRPMFQREGHLKIKTIKLPQIDIVNKSLALIDVIKQSQMEAILNNIHLPLPSHLPPVEIVSANVSLDHSNLSISNIASKTPLTHLPETTLKILNPFSNPILDARIKGDIQFPETPLEQGRQLLKPLGIKKFSGPANLDLNLRLQLSKPDQFTLNGRAGFNTVSISLLQSPIHFDNLSAELDVTPESIIVSTLDTMVVIPGAQKFPSEQFNLMVKGRIKNWLKIPLISIENLATSEIDLRSISSCIPWSNMEKSSQKINEILLAGGSIKFDRLTMNDIDVNHLPQTSSEWLSIFDVDLKVDQINIKPHKDYPALKKISSRITLSNGDINAHNFTGQLGPVKLPKSEIYVSGMGKHLKARGKILGPIQISKPGILEIDSLLRKLGFKNLIGSAFIDMRVDYDDKREQKIFLDGNFKSEGLYSESLTKNIVIKNLKGGISFDNREESSNLIFKNVTANINQAPVALDGKIIRLGTPDPRLTGRILTKNLNIESISNDFGSLKTYGVRGNLSSDLQFDFSKKNMGQSWIKGKIQTKGFEWSNPSKNIKIKDGYVNLQFKKRRATLNVPRVVINNQALQLTGSGSYLKNPVVSLNATSLELDLDQLISETQRHPVSKGNIEESQQVTMLPSWTNKLTADVSIKVEKGVYRSVSFQNFNAVAGFQKSRLHNCLIAFDIADGHAEFNSTADLKKLNKIPFSIQPSISNLKIEKMSPIFKMDEMPVSGPLSVNGKIDGCINCSKNNSSSVKGRLKLHIKKGALSKTGYLGKITANVFSLLNLKSILTGEFLADLSEKGILFDEISANLKLDDLQLGIENFLLFSSSVNAAGKGQVNLHKKNMAIETMVEPLGTLNKAIGYIPLLGKAAQKLTMVYLKIDGPLDDPTILPMPSKKLKDFLKETLAIPAEAVDSIGGLRDTIIQSAEEEIKP